MTAEGTNRTSQTGFAIREVFGALWRAIVGLLARLGGFARGALGRLRPVLATVTPLGWLVVVAALVSFLLVGVLGWAEFAFVGCTLAAAFVVSLFFLFGRATYAVTIELNPRRVTAGDRAMGRLAVTNSGTRPVLPTRMELPVGVGVAEFVVPRLAPAAENEDLFAIPTERRALIVAGPTISVRGDQLGLVRRTARWSEQIELFVHPPTTRIAASARGLVRDLEGHTTKAITNSDLAFHALRTYEPGDDIRNVHWRTSARTGQLMVRQYNETRRSQLLLLLSAERTSFASDDEFELAVSLAASIGVAVIREETELDVVWEGAKLRERTPLTLLDDSCRIEPVTSRHANLREFARITGARLPNPSLVIFVVGSLVSAAELHAAGTLYGSDTEVVAVRADVGADSGLRKVGDMVVATTARLKDLSALMERAGR